MMGAMFYLNLNELMNNNMLTNVGLKLGQRRGLWSQIKPALVGHILFAGTRFLWQFTTFCADTVFRHQSLWNLESITTLKEYNIYNVRRPMTMMTGIPMKQKELTQKDIYDDFKLKIPFGLRGLCKHISAI